MYFFGQSLSDFFKGQLQPGIALVLILLLSLFSWAAVGLLIAAWDGL